MDVEKTSLAGAIHDLQARLGSIRIAVTAVAGLDLDDETQSMMLTSAADESVRASAELACIGALARCLLDRSDPAPCDIAAALNDAAESARMAGLDVQTTVPPLGERAAMAHAQVTRLTPVLSALMRLVSGAGNAVVVSAAPDGDRVRLSIRRTGLDTEALPPVAGYLVDVLGGERDADDDDGVTLFLAAAR